VGPLVYGIVPPWSLRWRDRAAATIVTSFRKPPHCGKASRKNHAFVDGNKRVAVTMTAAFLRVILRVNGYRLEFDDIEAFLSLADLYETGRIRFQALDGWLCERVVAADSSV
jgi:hypothetical protein